MAKGKVVTKKIKGYGLPEGYGEAAAYGKVYAGKTYAKVVRKAARKLRKRVGKGLALWRRLYKEQLKKGDSPEQARKNANKRYAEYKKTGKVPAVI